ncbi:unnamed protein product [Clonostachys rhizophaga]|uniref:Pre-rRNA-processing protein RIX1 n=1 Tax=Clonostachys rhizophaga TaxID=160324 RepID=A0A9N9VL86_9HYPO|nr:unnamed protein product [Clonostachys rhizophaga]
MATALSPDLQVICKKLASNSPNQLLQSLPSLVNHVLRSKQALSASQDPKSSRKGGSSEISMLVHKLKSQITTLIQSHNKVARFVAISLIKAAVDVGGWEVLQGSETWVRELLSIIQKGDPLASKELAVAALTKIYVLIHPYQTLNREIATKTIPAFATACVQLLKSAASDDASLDSLSTAEVVCDALSTLIPLYPATLRPSSSQTQTAVRKFLAPTLSDGIFIPGSLQHASRRVVILQHFVAAKTGGSEEWLKTVTFVINELHSTADQVLRAVDEAWTPADGSSRGVVDLESEPHGGGTAPNLTPWTGIQAGTQRIIGLLQYISDCLRSPTKGQVAVPLAKIMDAASRLCLVARLSPKTQSWDQSIQTRAAIGRDEKEELWSAIPDIHVAVLQVFRVLIQRFEKDTLPLVPEILDHIIRVFNSATDNGVIRTAAYQTLKDALSIAGPTLSRPTVDMLGPIISGCCRDLQEDSGHLKQPNKQASNSGETKKNGISVNADLFLQKPQDSAGPQSVPLNPRHKVAASALLASLLAELPQQHLKPSLRSLLDQTAILTKDRDAMLASVLNPYLDPKGRRYASLLPHLTQQYPQDPALDILRTNLRTDVGAPVVDQTTLDEEDEAVDDADEDMAENENEADNDMSMDVDEKTTEGDAKSSGLPAGAQINRELPVQSNPFSVSKTEKPAVASSNAFGDVRPRAASPPKRKHEGPSPANTKRRELQDRGDLSKPAPAAPAEVADDDDDDSDESVHLNMELEDDDEDEDEDE